MMYRRAEFPAAALRAATCLLRSLFLALLLLPWGCFGGPVAHGESGEPGEPAPSSGEVRAYKLGLRPLVALSFDDVHQDVYDTAFPILRARGIPATYYFITQFLSPLWEAQLNDLEDHGWEIGSHSRTHRNLAGLGDADVVEELEQSRADLAAAGLDVAGLAYPFGSGYDDAAVLRRVKQHYAYARSVRPGNNAPILRQYALASMVVTKTTSIETMKSWIDLAVDRRQWLIILLHNVDDSGTDYSISPAVFTELADYVKARVDAGELDAVTEREGVARYGQRDWQPVYSSQPLGESDVVIMNDRVLWRLGSRISDYLYDGYEWVENGGLRYYGFDGTYPSIHVPSGFALKSIDPSRAIAEITLSSDDREASVLSEITLAADSPLAQVRTIRVTGSPKKLVIAKDLARRFTVDEGSVVTDGVLETHLRTYGDGVWSFVAFDEATGLIRILTHLRRASHSEYADYTRGEFRCGTLDVTGDLPFTWSVGGIVFDTLNLLVEAETGEMDGGATFYAGADASPQTGQTGVTLDDGEAITVSFTPPARGDYTLSVRHKSDGAGAQVSVQVGEDEPVIQAALGAGFGYSNTLLRDLRAQVHSVTVRAMSGSVHVDYMLLVPASRSAGTPAGIEFPGDVVRQAYGDTLMPLVIH